MPTSLPAHPWLRSEGSASPQRPAQASPFQASTLLLLRDRTPPRSRKHAQHVCLRAYWVRTATCFKACKDPDAFARIAGNPQQGHR